MFQNPTQLRLKSVSTSDTQTSTNPRKRLTPELQQVVGVWPRLHLSFVTVLSKSSSAGGAAAFAFNTSFVFWWEVHCSVAHTEKRVLDNYNPPKPRNHHSVMYVFCQILRRLAHLHCPALIFLRESLYSRGFPLTPRHHGNRKKTQQSLWCLNTSGSSHVSVQLSVMFAVIWWLKVTLQAFTVSLTTGQHGFLWKEMEPEAGMRTSEKGVPLSLKEWM